MKKVKNIFWVFIVLVILQLVKPALAQSPNAGTTPATPLAPAASEAIPQNQAVNNLYSGDDPNVARNLHTLSQNIFIEMLSGASCMLSGYDPITQSGNCLGINPQTKKIGYVTGGNGALGFMGSMIGYTYSIPVSGGQYMAYMGSHFGLAHPAYAQTFGPGFQGLTPLLTIWVGFRNITYLIFVILFTLLGLAIILRVKVDARTVMTIQNQIPKIIIGLILVTFSFAIAGFLVDFMYISVYVVLIVFNQISPHPNPSIFKSVFTYTNSLFAPSVPIGGDFLGIISITWNISRNIQQIVTGMFQSIIPTEIGAIFESPFLIFTAVGSGVCRGLGAFGIGNLPKVGDAIDGGCSVIQNYPALLLGAIGQLLAFIVILIALLFTLFRIWFSLIKSYAFIIVDTCIGPLWIVLGLFPGSTLGFGKWFRHLVAHLAMFPLVIGVLLLGKVIMDSIQYGGVFDVAGKSQLFAPPLLGNIGGNNAFAAFVGFGFILSIPQLMEKTKTGLQAPNFGLVAIGAAIGAARAVAGRGYGGVTGHAFGAKGEFVPDGQGGSKFKPISGPTALLKGMLNK